MLKVADSINSKTAMGSGYKKTEFGLIPDNWPVVLLDSVAKRGSGHTPSKNHPEYWNGGIHWISLADSANLDCGYIYATAATISPAGIANSSAVIHPVETVVLSRDAGVGKSAIMGRAMAVSQHFMAWQCGPKLNNVFLYYWLQLQKGEFERVAFGNTIKTIGLPYFKKLRIPLPPLPEQEAIAEALADVDALLAALDKLIAKKRAIKQAAMQQLLTGKIRLPGFTGEWHRYRQQDIVTFINGRAYQRTEWETQGTPVVRLQNLTGSGDEYYFSTLKLPEKQYMESGDLIFMWSASFGPHIWQGGRAIFHYHIWKIECNDMLVDKSFYYYKLVELTEQLKSKSDGSTMLHTTKRKMELQEITVPPLEEQKAISTVLSDMDTEITALEKRRDKTQQIKQGMMQQLLTGRIRLVNPLTAEATA